MTLEEKKEELESFLVGYWGDQTIKEGIDEILFVTVEHDDYHHEFLSMLDFGFEGVSNNNLEILKIIRKSDAAYIGDFNDAKNFLTTLREQYLKAYEEASTLKE